MSYYNSTPITQLTPGVAVLGTDVYPAVDTTDRTQSPVGSTKKYTITELAEYLQTQFGGNNLFSVLVASTGNFTASYNNGNMGVGATLTNTGGLTALVIDGVTMALGNRVLVKDQSDPAQNGIYTVTTIGSGTVAWQMTRSLDFDGSSPLQIQQGDFVVVVTGTLNQITMWVETAPGPFTVGTTPIIFQEQVVISAVTDGANLGSGDGLFTSVISTIMNFKSLIAGTNVTLGATGTDITINAVGSINAASNLGGTGLYAGTVGNTLDFKGITAGTNVNFSVGANAITINSTNTGGTITGGSSLGGTEAIYAGVSGTDLTFLGLTAGTNVTLNNDGAQITINASGGGGGGGIAWNNVTGTTQAASVGNGYVCSNVAATTVNLPATCAIGDLVSIQGAGTAGWVIQANTGQTVVLYNSSITTTTAGSVTCSGQYDGADLICIVADTTWAIHDFNSEILTFA